MLWIQIHCIWNLKFAPIWIQLHYQFWENVKIPFFKQCTLWKYFFLIIQKMAHEESFELWWWIFVSQYNIFPLFHLCGSRSESLFGIRIQIHKVAEYGSKLESRSTTLSVTCRIWNLGCHQLVKLSGGNHAETYRNWITNKGGRNLFSFKKLASINSKILNFVSYCDVALSLHKLRPFNI